MNGASRLQGLSPAAAQSTVATAQALESGRLDEAARLLAGVLAAFPDHPEPLRLHAGLLGMRGEHARALDSMRRAVAQRPEDPVYLNTLGSLLADSGDFDGAIECLQRACRLQPDLVSAWYNLGIVQTRCVRYADATRSLQTVLRLAPEHAAARAQLADALKGSGEPDAAADLYRAILRTTPWSGQAWWGLANIKTVAMHAADVQALHAALVDPRASADDRIACGFALARALDEQARYPQALQALADANAIARSRERWNAQAFAAAIDAIDRAFAHVPIGCANTGGAGVVFVVGLPRSGTTLAEQILASHSNVAAAGELPDLPLVLNAESARRGKPFPQWVGELQAAQWQSLGSEYLRRTAHWRTTKRVVVDKLPHNWIHAQAILAMLPQARIVVCRRDPLETCFSCYRQHFAGNAWSRDFADLGAYWRAFDASMRRLLARHPIQMRVLALDDLRADPQRVIRSLLEFCGLSFEPACLRFHETVRAVHSPSAAQVRQPLQAEAGHAARYGALLDPLRTALGLPPVAV